MSEDFSPRIFRLPQLIGLLRESNSPTVVDILVNIGKAFPEAVLLAIYPHLGMDGNTDGTWRGKLQRISSSICDAHPCVSASIQKIMTEVGRWC